MLGKIKSMIEVVSNKLIEGHSKIDNSLEGREKEINAIYISIGLIGGTIAYMVSSELGNILRFSVTPNNEILLAQIVTSSLSFIAGSTGVALSWVGISKLLEKTGSMLHKVSNNISLDEKSKIKTNNNEIYFPNLI